MSSKTKYSFPNINAKFLCSSISWWKMLGVDQLMKYHQSAGYFDAIALLEYCNFVHTSNLKGRQ